MTLLPDGRISIVMPAYNEAQHILDNLRETIETLDSLHCDYEIILVDDGSPDKTYLEAVKIASAHPGRVKVIRYDSNEGKGSALICGTRYAKGDYIVFLDADMDLHPEQLPTFFEIMAQENADAVVGSKLHPRSNVNYPLSRRLYTMGYYGLVRLMFGLPLRDTQTGLKVFKAGVLRRVLPKVLVKRFAADIEVLALAHSMGYRIREAPVTLFFQRKFGRVRLRDILLIFRDTLAIYYRLNILHYYESVSEEWQAPRQEVEVLTGEQAEARV